MTDGHSPDDVGPGKIIEVLQNIIDSAPGNKTETTESGFDATIEQLSDKLATRIEEILKQKMERKRDGILKQACSVLLGD